MAAKSREKLTQPSLGGKGERSHLLYSLAIVLQSKLYALHKAVEAAKNTKLNAVNIMCDSRSSFDLLQDPKLTHALSKNIKECIKEIKAEGSRVVLFWFRAYESTAYTLENRQPG